MPEKLTQCVICNNEIENDFIDFHRDTHEYKCDVCGNVYIIYEVIRFGLNRCTDVPGHIISGYTREITELGLKPRLIKYDNINSLLCEVKIPLTVSDRIDKILLYLENRSDLIGKLININFHKDYPIAYLKNFQELEFLFNQMELMGLIEKRISTKTMKGQVFGEARPTVKGWNRIDELHKKIVRSNQAFVAMKFNDEMMEIFKSSIKPAIENSEKKFKALLISEEEFNDKICDRIIAEIRKSAFIVADFTGQRSNVYFEAGFALGLGIPVIWMCRKDQEDKIGENFDTRQYKHIIWKDGEDLYKQLLDRINATIITP